MKYKFKVGDRVRIVNNAVFATGWYSVGSIGIVRDTVTGNGLPPGIQYVDGNFQRRDGVWCPQGCLSTDLAPYETGLDRAAKKVKQ